jgi:DNA adenine methylase
MGVIYLKIKNISPLRYPGGKARLANFIAELIELNNLHGCTYVETFAGGAGAALLLLINDIVKNIIINDCDPAIYAFWYSILNETEKFCDMIFTTPVNIEEWHKQKDIYNSSNDIFKLGFATFFLNRTNRSGILKGGVIGGLKQEGHYKIDCRFKKNDLIKRIKTIALFKNNIKLYCMDAGDFICNNLNLIPNKALIYLDPPYYKKGPGLYTNFYNETDHKALSDLVKQNIKQPWIMTYDNVKEVSLLYKDYRQTKYFLNYSANNKYKGQEILIYSNNIIPLVSPNLKLVI